MAKLLLGVYSALAVLPALVCGCSDGPSRPTVAHTSHALLPDDLTVGPERWVSAPRVLSSEPRRLSGDVASNADHFLYVWEDSYDSYTASDYDTWLVASDGTPLKRTHLDVAGGLHEAFLR